jgi:hypothetical protein
MVPTSRGGIGVEAGTCSLGKSAAIILPRGDNDIKISVRQTGPPAIWRPVSSATINGMPVLYYRRPASGPGPQMASRRPSHRDRPPLFGISDPATATGAEPCGPFHPRITISWASSANGRERPALRQRVAVNQGTPVARSAASPPSPASGDREAGARIRTKDCSPHERRDMREFSDFRPPTSAVPGCR